MAGFFSSSDSSSESVSYSLDCNNSQLPNPAHRTIAHLVAVGAERLDILILFFALVFIVFF
jgi:hypothetical protein